MAQPPWLCNDEEDARCPAATHALLLPLGCPKEGHSIAKGLPQRGAGAVAGHSGSRINK